MSRPLHLYVESSASSRHFQYFMLQLVLFPFSLLFFISFRFIIIISFVSLSRMGISSSLTSTTRWRIASKTSRRESSLVSSRAEMFLYFFSFYIYIYKTYLFSFHSNLIDDVSLKYIIYIIMSYICTYVYICVFIYIYI